MEDGEKRHAAGTTAPLLEALDQPYWDTSLLKAIARKM
jgi:hypothetical protein